MITSALSRVLADHLDHLEMAEEDGFMVFKNLQGRSVTNLIWYTGPRGVTSGQRMGLAG